MVLERTTRGGPSLLLPPRLTFRRPCQRETHHPLVSFFWPLSIQRKLLLLQMRTRLLPLRRNLWRKLHAQPCLPSPSHWLALPVEFLPLLPLRAWFRRLSFAPRVSPLPLVVLLGG